jgi:nicotinamidase/pyrazinamidase
MKAPGPGDALIVVDVQQDFLPGGTLGVPHGDVVIAPLNRLIDAWSARGLPVYVTRDWHPPNHCSFAPQGGPWPAHCVAGTPGAEFSPALHIPTVRTIVSKATQAQEEAYSVFKGTGLLQQLRTAGTKRIVLGGLATDYCVLYSGIDARAAGLDVVILKDAVCAVDVHPGDGDRALQELAAAGAALTTCDELAARLGSAR